MRSERARRKGKGELRSCCNSAGGRSVEHGAVSETCREAICKSPTVQYVKVFWRIILRRPVGTRALREPRLVEDRPSASASRNAAAAGRFSSVRPKGRSPDGSIVGFSCGCLAGSARFYPFGGFRAAALIHASVVKFSACFFSDSSSSITAVEISGVTLGCREVRKRPGKALARRRTSLVKFILGCCQSRSLTNWKSLKNQREYAGSTGETISRSKQNV